MFLPTSRYSANPVRVYVTPEGERIAYASARRVPLIDPNNVKSVVRVEIPHRLDLIAASQIGDPQAFWGIADVNPTLDPFELTRTAGNEIAIPRVIARGGV
ncbi:MAG: hypothetical protein U0414_16940 [Polyangiaceae bacterium]